VKSVIHDPEAQCDIFAAVRFYEARRDGLGEHFLRALDATIAKVALNPQMFALYEKPVRSCRISGFPYRVLFVEESQFVLVVAVSHLARKPGWWRHRLED